MVTMLAIVAIAAAGISAAIVEEIRRLNMEYNELKTALKDANELIHGYNGK